MMDPLSAFSVACNVIQIVEVGCKVLSSAAEYRKAADGVLNQQRELREVARTLNNLSVNLQSSLNDPSKTGQVSPEEIRLIEANNECLKVSKDFIGLLDRLKVKDRNTTLESLRMSIKARWYKDRMDTMQQALSEARDNLNIAFLLYMHSQQTAASAKTNDRISGAAVNIEQSILAAVDSTSTSIQAQIKSLAESLKETYLDSEEHTADAFLANHQDVLQDIAGQLRAIGSSQVLLRATATEDRQSTAQQMVLESLHFKQIYYREEQVHRAYESTYQWILQPLEAHWAHWDCFLTWINAASTDQHLYWIHGKPGSGKSTIMKFLDNNLNVAKHMSVWAGGKPVLKARCFFWAAGSEPQKSFAGLHRSLLFQLLEEVPHMISRVVPRNRWKAAQFPGRGSMEWTHSELRDCLTQLLEKLQDDFKVLLLIDGLDEFEGTDQEKDDLVSHFNDLALLDNVKVCVSSRPMNLFQDAFGHCRQLRLEHLTQRDIAFYTTSCLERNSRFQFFKQHYSIEAKALVFTIVDRAAGVFLWVRLVMTDLLRGLRDGDSIVQLQERLMRIPTDLDDYFLAMINSIEPQHRREASLMFHVALYTELEFVSVVPLTLMDISFMDEEREDFVIAPGYQSAGLNLRDAEAMMFRADSTLRKLNSRCMGLLECSKTDDIWSSGEAHTFSTRATTTVAATWSLVDATTAFNGEFALSALFDQKVDFIHRSLRDFLLQERIQRILRQYTNQSPDVRTYLCSARIAQYIARVDADINDDFTLGLGSHIVCALSVNRDSPSSGHMARMIKAATERLVANYKTPAAGWFIGPSVNSWEQEESNFLTLAIDFRLNSYVLPRLTPEIIQSKTGRPILDYILRPRFLDVTTISLHNSIADVDLLHAALSRGARPNEVWQAVGASVWALFLCCMADDEVNTEGVFDRHGKRAVDIQAIRMMAAAGADPVLPFSWLSTSTFYARYDSWETSDDEEDKYPYERFQRRWPSAKPISQSLWSEAQEPYYTVSSLLKDLRGCNGPGLEPLRQELKEKEKKWTSS